jgi:cell division protein FtsI/penicillin-binding protein 2
MTVYEVGLELADVKNPQTIAESLNILLGLDYASVLGAASIPYSSQAVYRVVADNVSQDQIDKLKIVIEQLDAKYAASDTRNQANIPSLSGVVYRPHLARAYPEKTLAANIIGFVGSGNQGYFGAEGKFNDLLAGKTKTILVPVDPLHAGDQMHGRCPR